MIYLIFTILFFTTNCAASEPSKEVYLIFTEECYNTMIVKMDFFNEECFKMVHIPI